VEDDDSTNVPGSSSANREQHSSADRVQSVSWNSIMHWIVNNYRHQLGNCTRLLLEQDFAWLREKAGFGGASATAELSSAQLTTFKEWYSNCLSTLSAAADAWDSQNPEIICGFSVDRRLAEELLQGHPPGTFVVRLCSEPGCIAMTVWRDSPVGFKHVLIDRKDLRERSLFNSILMEETATHLLDVSTGNVFPKETFIHTNLWPCYTNRHFSDDNISNSFGSFEPGGIFDLDQLAL